MRQRSANPETELHSTRGSVAPATRRADLRSTIVRIRRWLGLACAALAGLFGLSGQALANDRPNIVLVQVDDMSRALLNPVLADGKPTMPNLQALIDGEGANFTNYYNTTPLCSPSRSALLSGQFGRNSKLTSNNGTFGGWSGWQGRDILDRNIATTLQDSGYHTAHFGKFLNDYDRGLFNPLTVPPGWNTWASDATDQSSRSFYGYQQLVRIERGGEVVEGGPEGEFQGPFGDPTYADDEGIDPASCAVDTPRADDGITDCNYHTDRMTRLAAKEIQEVDQPLFVQLDYFAPHADDTPPSGPQPATRHLGLARNAPLPKGPAFNERNTSDKAFLVQRGNGLLSDRAKRGIGTRYRTGLESLRAVDEGIGYLIETLEQTNKLDNTYFIFVSDNGFFFGEHRFPRSKVLPYEPSARVPLLIRGPGINGSEVADLASTVDLAPTILEAAEVESGFEGDYPFDGRSLMPTLQGEKQPRRAVVVETISDTEMRGGTLPMVEPTPLNPRRPTGKTPYLSYRTIRIGRHKYTKYTQGGEELYDLRRDPHELYSQARNPEYRVLKRYMRGMLDQYRSCSGEACLEPPPEAPPPGEFRLDARRPPKRFPIGTAYLFQNAVYGKVKCKSGRRCGTARLFLRGQPVTETVVVPIRVGSERRVKLPLIDTSAAKKLQLASEQRRRVELRHSIPSGSDSRKTRITRPVLRQN